MADKKLPTPIQLALLSATVVVILCVVQLAFFARAISTSYGSLDLSAASASTGFYAVLAERLFFLVAGAITFFAICTGHLKTAARAALGLHGSLLIYLVLSMAYWLIRHDGRGYADVSGLGRALPVLLAVIWAFWLVWVAKSVFPYAIEQSIPPSGTV